VRTEEVQSEVDWGQIEGLSKGRIKEKGEHTTLNGQFSE